MGGATLSLVPVINKITGNLHRLSLTFKCVMISLPLCNPGWLFKSPEGFSVCPNQEPALENYYCS